MNKKNGTTKVPKDTKENIKTEVFFTYMFFQLCTN